MSNPENVATIDALAKLLAVITGRPEVAINSMARKLRDAGMLPEDGEPITPEHAANFVVAAVASSAASEAVATVSAYDTTPLWRAHAVADHGNGRALIDSELAENMLPPPFLAGAWPRVSRSLVGAIAYFIEAARDRSGQLLPTAIGFLRSLTSPAAHLELRLPPINGVALAAWFDFANRREDAAAARLMEGLRMVVWANVPGLLIREIGDLLSGASGVVVAPATVPAFAVHDAEAK